MLIRLSKVAIVTALLVISLGALTRLLDAGLGCPDWPGCYGQLLPPDKSEHIRFADIDSGKAWLEMIHRYLATTLGLLIIMINILIERTKNLPSRSRWLSRTILLLVIIQGLFGMLTVTMKLLPQVVTLHLLGGMALLALLLLLHLQLQTKTLEIVSSRLRLFSQFVLVLLFLQISLGGWTSSNYAGLACPDFPTCQQQWLPNLALTEAFSLSMHDVDDYTGGVLSGEARVTIQVVHRIVALMLLIAVMSLAHQLWKHPSLRRQTQWLVGLTVLQVCLGISNAVLMLPLSLALAHNTGAALLLLNVVYINFQLVPARPVKAANHIIGNEAR